MILEWVLEEDEGQVLREAKEPQEEEGGRTGGKMYWEKCALQQISPIFFSAYSSYCVF